MTLSFKSAIIEGMREKLFKELEEKYTDYLYGKCSFSAVNRVEEQLKSLLIQDTKVVLSQIEEVEHKIQEEYDRSIGEPLIEELLEFLRFKGLIKGPEYYKKALKLKEKLEKYDRNLMIRKRAVHRFLIVDKGFNSIETIKMVDSLLELGALYTGNFWMYEK